ncbi:MAG: hypothetical protein ROZ00_12135 [Denitratisoma sp.]|nr:hypothetical protein [Denitratisoma sp.]
MKTRRLVVPIQEAQAGMRLAEEVRNAAGAVLLTAGTELDDAVLAGLCRRGVECIVVDRPDPRSEAEIADELARMEARVQHLFHRHRGNPEMQSLMQAVLDYRRKALA